MFSQVELTRQNLPAFNDRCAPVSRSPCNPCGNPFPVSWSQDNYQRFLIMMNPEAMHLVADYLNEEMLFIQELNPLIRHSTISKFVAVGDANFFYYPIITEAGINYLCIDPLAGSHVEKKKALIVQYYRGTIEEHLADIACETNTFIHFTFNVVSYLQQARELLLQLARFSSIITLSVWSDNELSKKLFNRYKQFMNLCLPEVEQPLQQSHALSKIITSLPIRQVVTIKGKLCTLYTLIFDQEAKQ